jgi:hypothetical protein
MSNMVTTLPARPSQRNPKLLDQVRDVIRRKHFSIRTEQAYTDWMIYRHTLNKPGDSNAKPLGSYVKRIQTEGDVSAHGKFAKARTPSPARETRALPQAGASA